MSEELDVPPRLPGECWEDWIQRINEANDYTPGKPEEPRSEVEPYDTEKWKDVRLPHGDD